MSARRQGGRRSLRRKKVTVGQMARYTTLALNRAEDNRRRRLRSRLKLALLVAGALVLVGAAVWRVAG